MSKNHIVKTKRGFLAVVEGGHAKEITSKAAIAEIKRLINIRRKAGKELSKLIRDKGCITASVNFATRTRGAGAGD